MNPIPLTGAGEVPLRLHDHDRLAVVLLALGIAPGLAGGAVQLVGGVTRNLGGGYVPGNLQVHVMKADEAEVRAVPVIVIRVGLPVPAEGVQDVVDNRLQVVLGLGFDGALGELLGQGVDVGREPDRGVASVRVVQRRVVVRPAVILSVGQCLVVRPDVLPRDRAVLQFGRVTQERHERGHVHLGALGERADPAVQEAARGVGQRVLTVRTVEPEHVRADGHDAGHREGQRGGASRPDGPACRPGPRPAAARPPTAPASRTR